MRYLSTHEKSALEHFSGHEAWLSAREIGSCRLTTLNKLHEKGYLERRLRPGAYTPTTSIVFRRLEGIDD